MEKRRFSAVAPPFVKETDNQIAAKLTLPHHSLLRVRVNVPLRGGVNAPLPPSNLRGGVGYHRRSS